MSSIENVIEPVQKTGPDGGYWRSLGQLHGVQDPNLGAEFLPEQLEPMDGTSRRRFMQIMGASVAMAGAVGCSRVHRHVVPAAKGIEGRTIGQTQPFATAMEIAGVAVGLLAQSYEGRPIRLDGNPLHPMNKGSVSAWATASILGLYDPDRSKAIRYRANPKTAVVEKKWDDVTKALRTLKGELAGKQGEGLRVLSEATSSATMASLKSKLLAELPKAQWIEYEQVSRDNERLGTKLLFNQPLRVDFDLTKAAVICDLDADLLAGHPASLQYARDFASNRSPEATLAQKAMYNRLYCVESNLSSTGGTADHRLAYRSTELKQFITVLAARVNAGLKNMPVPADAKLETAKQNKFVEVLAKDLVANKGKCVLAVGFRQPPEVHAMVHDLNVQLGNVGTTVKYYAAPEGDVPAGPAALAALTKEMQAEKVSTLLIINSNPVYTAPADLKFSEALGKVTYSIHIGSYVDETADQCAWHLPMSHYLEAWNDVRSWDGTQTIQQPLIEPLFKTRSAVEYVGLFVGAGSKGYDLVQNTFKANGGTDASWKEALRDGVVKGSAWKTVAAKPATTQAQLQEMILGLTTLTLDVAREGESRVGLLEAVFIPDSKVFDGRFGNNAWLQELPDFITKLTWDNAVLMSDATAKRYQVKHGQFANFNVRYGTVKAPVYVQPGHADGSLTFLLGYGRKAAGTVGGTAVGKVSTVGFDFTPIRSSTAMNMIAGVVIQPVNEYHPFACTQEHSQIDTTGMRERDMRDDILIRSDSLAHYLKHPDDVKHRVHELPQIKLFENPLDSQKTDYKWGMTIDLAKCTGCNACVIACQSENNIPVVGKQEVINQREMHWLRIDRYFHGDSQHLDDVTVVHQPMMCVHCENAPCEQVCPVAATVHSAEGTNDMVYNRCIGTRYCANNCPFKVRRFNFLNWHKQLDDEKNNVIRLSFNPEVTVRSRGVMEKCTYCIQRIKAAKIKVKNQGVKELEANRPETKLKDGDVVTACQQACPAGAITFGDLSNKASKVAMLAESQRGYKMLGDLNIRPRTSYLARIRNPHPELEPAKSEKEAGHGHHG
jgi:MoCo/4Fe-4S cofactor protein with predicted Tat translocation signal